MFSFQQMLKLYTELHVQNDVYSVDRQVINVLQNLHSMCNVSAVTLGRTSAAVSSSSSCAPFCKASASLPVRGRLRSMLERGSATQRGAVLFPANSGLFKLPRMTAGCSEILVGHLPSPETPEPEPRTHQDLRPPRPAPLFPPEVTYDHGSIAGHPSQY